jgi:predicted dehydrogenase/HEAT repeat protein
MNRRRFLKGAIGAAATITIVPRRALGGPGYTAPSDEITKAIIGVGGMGRGHMDYEGARLLAVCDVDQEHLRRAIEKAGPGVEGYLDFREVLDRPDIDIVHIATPPHWHALMAIAAAEAGKDIWCEKPMTRTIGEGMRVVEAVQRNRRIFRLNTWFRFRSRFYGMDIPVREIKKVVDSGMLGWPLKVTVSGITGFDWKFQWSGLPNLRPERIPAELDYDMWLGPAPWKPYHPHRVHGSFRGYWDYDGGGLGDMGQHYLDPVQYLLGKDDTSPVEIDIDAPQQHPDAVGSWRRITLRYDDGCEIILDGENRDDQAAYLEGPRGRLFRGFTSDVPNFERRVAELPDPEPQVTDFIEAVRNRQTFALNESNAHRSCTIVNLGKIALRLRRKLRFDPDKQQFIGDEEANRLIFQPMRAPWHLILLASVTLLSGCAASGTGGRPGSEVRMILSEMPADNAAEEDRANRALLALGPEAIRSICRQLTPAGRGDDTAARYALSGLTTYVHRPELEPERLMYARVLIQELDATTDSDVGAFLIRQLQLAGREEAIGPLGRFLLDERLCEPATQALVAIGARGAEGELLTALPVASGRNRITIVKALGDLRSKAAVFEIMKFAVSNDYELRQAALYALANIGPVDTENVLSRAAGDESGYRMDQATSYQLLYASRLAESGQVVRSARIYRELIFGRTGPESAYVRIAALSALVALLGEEAMTDLQSLVEDENESVSATALELAEAMPGESVTLAWMRALQAPGRKSGDRIRSMLLRRDRAHSVPALEDARVAWALADSSIAAWPRIRTTPDSMWEAANGFVPLFNGVDLSGWMGDTISYLPLDGSIVIDPDRTGGGGNLYTEEEYDDFVLRFEFRLSPGANNGLGIRTPPEGDAAYVGMELQILDDSADQYAGLRPYQFHGSIYGVVPTRRGFQMPVGAWNTQEVIAVGRRIIVILNGTVVVDADIDIARTPRTMDGRNHPGLERTTGHIGFLGHGSVVEFRNLRLKRLSRR